MAGSLNGNIIVVGEVDASVLLRGVVGDTEQFAFQTGVCGTRDMFAVAPLAISGAAGRGTSVAAACVTWVSVSIWVERWATAFSGAPSGVGVTIGTTGAEIRSVGISPVTTTRASSV